MFELWKHFIFRCMFRGLCKGIYGGSNLRFYNLRRYLISQLAELHNSCVNCFQTSYVLSIHFLKNKVQLEVNLYLIS